MNLNIIKKNCQFDSCRNGACSSLEQAANECKGLGFCIDWRGLTNRSCSTNIFSAFLSFFSGISWHTFPRFMNLTNCVLVKLSQMNSSLNLVSVDLTHVSDVTCPEGLVYDECRNKLDDFCSGGFGVFKEHSIKPKMFRLAWFSISCFSSGCTESNILELPSSTTVQAAFVPLAKSGQETTTTSVCLTAPVSNAVIFD